MEFDTDFVSILREVVQFLESLHNIDLPSTFQSTRDNLLQRTKSTLQVTFISPEPYLDMNGGKGLPLVKKHNDVPEYVEAEETQVQASQQDYYETFQKIEGPKTEASSSSRSAITSNRQGENVENALVNIYASLSAQQTKSKCHKCGPVFRKEGRKLFVFEQYRSCWIGLVGSHLLIYGSERDNRPYMVLPIRGYMGRPAPNIVSRDQTRSKSAFEIFCPGYKTFQFIAQTPKDMEQWVEVVCHMGYSDNDECVKAQVSESIIEVTESELRNGPLNETIECYQDVGPRVSNGTRVSLSLRRSPISEHTRDNKADIDKSDHSLKDTSIGTSSPPPLPTRSSRCLPSLPQIDLQVPAYEPMEDAYDEDDIYHKIEDFRDVAEYQNVTSDRDPTTTTTTTTTKKCSSKVEDLETYDDVQAVAENLRAKKELERELTMATRRMSEEQYDDIESSSSIGLDCRLNKTFEQERERDSLKVPTSSSSYDDVRQLVAKKELQKRKDEKEVNTTKVVHKKSFLDRMRKRKESPKKEIKKGKQNTLVSNCLANSEVERVNVEKPTKYDDIAVITVNMNQNDSFQVEEPSEYHSPPPPRPIYGKPPTIDNVCNNNGTQYYDDVGGYQGSIRNSTNEEIVNETYNSKIEFVEMTSENQKNRAKTISNIDVRSVTNGLSQITYIEPNQMCTVDNSIVELDSEHYQTPRTKVFRQVQSVILEEEELYDDVAIVAEKARLRELTKKEVEQNSTCTNKCNYVLASPEKSIHEKKHWNRFGSGKKDKPIDVAVVELNKELSGELEDYDDCFAVSTEQHGIRMNTLQKLINKVENSLGKTTSRSATSLPKSHASNDVT